MVLVTFGVVIMRYLFDQGSIAWQESITYMHGMLFMVGAAYTLRHDGHVRVDLIYRPLSPRGKAVVDLLGSLILLLPFAVFLFWVSWDYVAASWAVKEGSREAGGLDAVYLLKSIILVMPALMILQGAIESLKALFCLLGIQSELCKLEPEHEEVA
uniref:TRAP transporter small permease protein n=1 Tax=Magnetococcus massalia (strain MO-1) TaxID=451514 RepID=A0A1S7LKC5_MAGMO